MLLNALLFQAGWLVCVMERGRMALAITALILLVHHVRVMRNRREWLFIAAFSAWGLLQDGLLIQAGILRIDGYSLPPPWLLGLWLLFASTLNHSLSWLQNRPWQAAVAGGLGAPLSYLAGARLDALTLDPFHLPLLALLWAAILPLAFFCNTRLLANPKSQGTTP